MENQRQAQRANTQVEVLKGISVLGQITPKVRSKGHFSCKCAGRRPTFDCNISGVDYVSSSLHGYCASTPSKMLIQCNPIPTATGTPKTRGSQALVKCTNYINITPKFEK